MYSEIEVVMGFRCLLVCNIMHRLSVFVFIDGFVSSLSLLMSMVMGHCH